jgi:HTH-type transcriptional regulator, competence development regulator
MTETIVQVGFEKPNRPLAMFLRTLRDTRRLSLREVEEATNKTVSNAYLSQLEHGKISKPSPNILYALSTVYAVPYDVLMQKAGYIAVASIGPESAETSRKAAFVDETLTDAEEEELLRYLAYLRSRQRAGK